MNDFERLCAFLDNELSLAERRTVEERLAKEPQLRTQLAALQEQNRSIQAAFAQLDAEPLPDDLLSRIHTHPEQNAQGAVLPFCPKRRFISTWAWGSAASLALAFGLWWFIPNDVPLPEVLVSALNSQPAGAVIELNPKLRIEILATYPNSEQVCRALLEHRPESSTPTTACWYKGRWQIEQATQMQDSYQTASSDTTRPQAFNAEQERAWLESIRKH